MYPLDLPVFAAPMPPAPIDVLPQPVLAGIVAPHPEFADALAGFTGVPADPVTAAEAEADTGTGKELPPEAQPTGKPLPVSLFEVLAPVVLAQPVAITVAVNAARSPMPVELPAQAQPPQEQPAHGRPVISPPVMPLADPAHHPLAEETTKAPAPPITQEGARLVAEMLALPPRSSDGAGTPIAVRDAPAAAPLPSSAFAPASAPQLAPGAQLEQLVEALAQARETGKGARGDIAVRHAEFGLLAIRLEADSGETRAQITARDPGFAPAMVAALAERANTGSADQQPQQRGQDQSWGQSGSAHGDPRQQERRQSSAETRAVHGNAASGPGSSEPDQPTRTDPHSRFA